MANTPVSPKVTAGINWGIIATLAVGVLTSVTPQMLSGLGSYQSMVWVLIGSGLTALRAYLKADPLRVAPAEAVTVDAPTALPSVYPADAVADAEAAVEVTPIVPTP